MNSAPRRGRELARMISRWTASTEPQAPEDPLETAESFERARLAAEAWYREAYPTGLPPMELDAAPRWTEAEIAAFLERAAPRPGDPDVGRAVFEAAGCAACHAVGSTPAGDPLGFGPDLAGVAERLSRAELLAAILAPSRVVSDQYRASIALTKDERLFEGFVTVRDADGIELRTLGGESVRIDSDELESLGPSTRSPMPEGLLESRTLEEIRDLFAYLKEGRGSAGARVWAPLFGNSGLKGWDGDSAVWSLRGGLLSGRSQGLAQSSYALAPLPDRDLCVEFDVFLPPGANSGLAYRARRRDRDPEPLADPSGFQADLGQSHWGSLYVDGRGTVARPDPAALEAALDRRGWNHVLVRFRGEAHSMEINGLETYSAQVSAPEGALFGFQVHQGKPMQVRIANARWRTP
ncbi:MAG: DUF1080 domain-containing protein [Planctomycetes bacterium]|nr:DUF1080 domain-containing protein [Planctomycetota bacterium]